MGRKEGRELPGGRPALVELDARADLFCIAKRAHPPRRCSPKGERPAGEPQDGWTARAMGDYATRMVRYVADKGQAVEAEQRMEKLCQAGLRPDQSSYNALVTLLARQGDLERAEEWFRKPSEPALHPQLAGVYPDATSYRAMVVLCSDMGDMPRAEKYAREAEVAGIALDLRSFGSLVRACLAAGEPRRAHRWCGKAVDAGCRQLDKELVTDLVRALADAGNVQSANHWLTYMGEAGQRLDETTYEYVRAAHPLEIVPSTLSGEGARPRPPEMRPATVGTRSPAARGVDAGSVVQAQDAASPPRIAATASTEAPPASPRRVPRSVLARTADRALRAGGLPAIAGFNGTKLPRRRDPPKKGKCTVDAPGRAAPDAGLAVAA